MRRSRSKKWRREPPPRGQSAPIALYNGAAYLIESASTRFDASAKPWVAGSKRPSPLLGVCFHSRWCKQRYRWHRSSSG